LDVKWPLGEPLPGRLSEAFLYLGPGNVKEEHPDDFIEETRAFWGERTGRTFSREDAREMIANISGFFRILDEWDRKAKMEEAAESEGAGEADQC